MIIPPGAMSLGTECGGYGRSAEWARLAQLAEARKGFQRKNLLKGEVEGHQADKGGNSRLVYTHLCDPVIPIPGDQCSAL